MKLSARIPAITIPDIMIIRITVVLLYLVSGNLKWFSAEMQWVDALTSETWLAFLPSWLGHDGASYFLAVIEAAVAIALLAGVIFPVLGIVAASGLILSSTVMLTLLPEIMSISLSGLILKEIVLLVAGLVLLRHDIRRVKRHAPCQRRLL